MARINQLAAQVTHSADLQRLANSISNGQSGEFDKLAESIRAILTRHEYINSKKLLNELVRAITEEILNTNKTVFKNIEPQLHEAIAEEVSFQSSIVQAVSSKKIVMPPISTVNTALLNTPMVLNKKAYTWAERIGQFTSNQVKYIKQRVIAGWADGDTTQAIARDISGNSTHQGIIGSTKTSLNALVKDLTNHINSMTKKEVARKNPDVVIGERTIITLDSKTSPICRNYGSQNGWGKIWLYSKYGRNFPRPGFHIRCRSTNIFVINKKYDLDVDYGTRPAVVDGQSVRVAATTSWYELAKQYPSVAEDALGTTRAKLISDMSADDYQRAAKSSLGGEKTIEQMKSSNKKIAELLKG